MTTFPPALDQATMPQSWWSRATRTLEQLGTRPWTLVALLLALNALARPYVGLRHDSQMYCAQVLNRVEPGAYADDLFFRYGSQDQFSAFSALAAPLAAHMPVALLFLL